MLRFSSSSPITPGYFFNKNNSRTTPAVNPTPPVNTPAETPPSSSSSTSFQNSPSQSSKFANRVPPTPGPSTVSNEFSSFRQAIASPKTPMNLACNKKISQRQVHRAAKLGSGNQDQKAGAKREYDAMVYAQTMQAPAYQFGSSTPSRVPQTPYFAANQGVTARSQMYPPNTKGLGGNVLNDPSNRLNSLAQQPIQPPPHPYLSNVTYYAIPSSMPKMVGLGISGLPVKAQRSLAFAQQPLKIETNCSSSVGNSSDETLSSPGLLTPSELDDFFNKNYLNDLEVEKNQDGIIKSNKYDEAEMKLASTEKKSNNVKQDLLQIPIEDDDKTIVLKSVSSSIDILQSQNSSVSCSSSSSSSCFYNSCSTISSATTISSSSAATSSSSSSNAYSGAFATLQNPAIVSPLASIIQQQQQPLYSVNSNPLVPAANAYFSNIDQVNIDQYANEIVYQDDYMASGIVTPAEEYNSSISFPSLPNIGENFGIGYAEVGSDENFLVNYHCSVPQQDADSTIQVTDDTSNSFATEVVASGSASKGSKGLRRNSKSKRGLSPVNEERLMEEAFSSKKPLGCRCQASKVSKNCDDISGKISTDPESLNAFATEMNKALSLQSDCTIIDMSKESLLKRVDDNGSYKNNTVSGASKPASKSSSFISLSNFVPDKKNVVDLMIGKSRSRGRRRSSSSTATGNSTEE